MKLREAVSPILDAIYPPRCLACGAMLGADDGLCLSCWSALVIPGAPACCLCQRPFTNLAPADRTCPECRANPPIHDGIACATLYNDASRKLVLALKHGRKLALAPMMARSIAARLEGVDVNWLLVPVPLHRTRLWQRGYNQSALLARALARITGANLSVDALCRIKRTPALGHLGREERAAMLKDAIAAHPKRQMLLRGAKVVLIDDVLTSGATSNACITALLQAGASKVRIACYARVIEGDT